ncbi:response regulator [Lacimicrobium alkaliphilum]|uniref:Response regulator n=1 Tax=Lacimicrobium alkaliphilum TaxID=1526571 RepID=A0ABQ1RKA6_9ALTE|nr:response regulator [Lacimicrobium alkaliphilum]GGD73407.1 response regulator [Lacimicrobium alkaliphilum]
MSDLRKVLYVEDDPDIREIAELALEDVGGLILNSCASGELAIQQLEVFKPQVILLDVMMPGMDGPETLSAMRDMGVITDTVLVIFMTAKVHPDELQRYKNLGVEQVISKPFDPMTLADEVRALWDTFNA